MSIQQRVVKVLVTLGGFGWCFGCHVGWMGGAWAIPAKTSPDTEKAKTANVSSREQKKNSTPGVTSVPVKPSKPVGTLAEKRVRVSELGPPPPPAANEIPPTPPAFRPYQRPTGQAPQHPAPPQAWYHSPEYRRWLKRRRAQQRKRRRYFHKNPNRVQFWWSTETGLYLGSFSPIGGGTRSLDFLGLMTGGQIGLRYRSLILSVGTHVAFSLNDGKDLNDSFVGGSLVRLSGSLGWALGRILILESGVSMEYMQLKQDAVKSGALLFPAHFGVTLRLPVGTRYALGLRTLVSVAFDTATEGVYFSVTSNLVFQTL